MDEKFRNQNEQEILQKAKKGNKVKRMRPRYPRFLLPIFIVLLAVAVALVPILTDVSPELSSVLEVFNYQEKQEILSADMLKPSTLEEYAIEGMVEIVEDEVAINGVTLTPDIDYMVDSDFETNLNTIMASIKEDGFNSVFFNINYNKGYLTAIGGQKNTSFVADGLKTAITEANNAELRLYVVIDAAEYDLCNLTDLKNLQSFLVTIKNTAGVSGIMLKGINYLNHGLTYNDYLKLGNFDGYEEFVKEIFINNLERLAAEYKAQTNGGYLGVYCEANYDATNKTLIAKDKLLVTELINLNIFDSVLSFGFGSTNSVSHPFKDMTNALADGTKNTNTRLGFMLYSSKINNDYSNPDQLTRQLMIVNEIGNGMMVFDSYKALMDDTTGAAATAIKYMKGNLNNYQPKGLTFSSPTAFDFTTSYKSLAISGASDPEFELLLDGKPVERTESGFFSMQKELKVGDNVFTFKHKGTTRKIYVTYTYTVLKSVSPLDDLYLEGGSVLVVKANARIGSNVTATLNGKTITLKQGVDQSGDNTEKDSEFAIFEGSITLPEGSTTNTTALGKIKFTASHGGITNTGYSGSITLKKKPAQAPIYSPITHEGVKPGSRLIAEVTASYVETFDGDNTVDDLSRPTNSYLPKGTIDYVTSDKVYNSSINQYYVLLGYNKRVYKSEGNLKISQGTLPENNSVGIKSTSGSGQYTTIVLDMAFPFPHNIDVKPQSYTNAKEQDYTFKTTSFTYVEIYLPYTNSVSGNITDNPLFSKSEFIKSGSGYILKLHLKETGKFYGYTSYFDESGHLVLRFLNPTNTAKDTLAGVNILLDPGHGGSDGGAVGYDNKGREIKESETCLELCLAVKERLTRLGANVSMTRTTESYLAPATRTSIIRNSNAHLTVSIHRNSATNSNAHGIKTYHFNAWQKEPAVKILDALKANADIKAIHPTYTTSAWVRTDWHWFGYARISNMPVVLIEAGFMSNATDLEAILRDDFNDAQADAIVDGIVAYFNNQ